MSKAELEMSTEPVIAQDESILWLALRYARPHKSQAIETLMVKLESIAPIGARISRDQQNNLWIDTRQAATMTMFMAHLDTVASLPGSIPLFMSQDGIIETDGKNVLGADDGAGVALIASLMESGVPALYLFSQKEESGGDGGRFAATLRDKFYGIERLISFDRKGTTSICGEQMAGTLASRDFVHELAYRLGMGHQWDCGTYTDNSEFQDLIPEIVNVSIGYANNHGPMETLDYGYFLKLREACLTLDWETLPTVGPDTSNDFKADAWEGYFSKGDPCKSAFGSDPIDYLVDSVEIEHWDLCESIGIVRGTWEADMILDSLTRCFEDGKATSRRSRR